jgi:hypothetical protein
MARRTGGVGWYLVKWLVIPIVLAAIGFFIVGPRIANPGVVEVPDSDAQQEPAPGQLAGQSKGEPEVEVSATRLRARRPEPRREPEPQPEEPIPDEDIEPPIIEPPVEDPPVAAATEPPVPPDPPASDTKEPPRVGGGVGGGFLPL